MHAGGSRTGRHLSVALSLWLLGRVAVAAAPVEEREPIAYIGPGSFFDQEGRQLEVTCPFVERAQDWYRKRLLSEIGPRERRAFDAFERRLNEGIEARGQTRLVLRHRALDWLVAHSARMQSDGRTLGKLNALKYALHWKLPGCEGNGTVKPGEVFTLEPKIEKKLALPAFNAGAPPPPNR
jgi:hypothetical protein